MGASIKSGLVLLGLVSFLSAARAEEVQLHNIGDRGYLGSDDAQAHPPAAGSRVSFFKPWSGNNRFQGDDLEGVVVRSVAATNGDHHQVVDSFDVLVPSATPGGESTIYFVRATDGVVANSVSLGEYIAGLQKQYVLDMRNARTVGAFASKQLEVAGRELDKLNEKSRNTTDKYLTSSGRARLLGQIAVAVAVDKAGDHLPKRYKNLGRSQSATLNTVVKAGLDASGEVAGGLLKNPSKDGAADALKDGGITAGVQLTLAPTLLEAVKARKIAPEKADEILEAAEAVVKIAAAAGTADDNALEAAERQALDELYKKLPYGLDVFASDATDMATDLIDYRVVGSHLEMAQLNQETAIDQGRWAQSAARTLQTVGEYDQLIRADSLGSSLGAAGADDPGFNQGRGATTVAATASVAAQPIRQPAPGGAGIKRN